MSQSLTVYEHNPRLPIGERRVERSFDANAIN
jgi:hypothetical protein